MTQEQVAEALDTSQTNIAKLESGKRSASNKYYMRYAEVLGFGIEVHLCPLSK